MSRIVTIFNNITYQLLAIGGRKDSPVAAPVLPRSKEDLPHQAEQVRPCIQVRDSTEKT
jgi:hypothetical protein